MERMKSLTQEYIEQLQNTVKDLIDEKFELEEENKKLKEERIFSLGEYDYMILTSTTPQLKVYRKEDSGDVFTK